MRAVIGLNILNVVNRVQCLVILVVNFAFKGHFYFSTFFLYFVSIFVTLISKPLLAFQNSNYLSSYRNGNGN